MSTKQVIVMRNDLGLRKGKMIAQGSHASMAFLRESVIKGQSLNGLAELWLHGDQKKICVQVGSEEALLALHKLATECGVTAHLIKDVGYTEVEPGTATCLALGPDLASTIDSLTGNLKLL